MAQNQPDLTRNDKLYELKIPTYIHTKDSVYYEFHLKDLVKNQNTVKLFRFKELKEYYENLKDMELELPPFPKTHFFKKTNSDPALINERKNLLEKFFGIILNDPFTRGTKLLKKFLYSFKKQNRSRNTLSGNKRQKTSQLKVKSLEKTNSSLTINLKELKIKK